MAAPIVQFVDSISTTATLRYDFNQSAANYRCLPLGADGIDFGAPAYTGEPEGVGGYYSYRHLRFTQRIIGTRAVALARMSVLAKELLRPVNYLRFQWDPSASPVFFKTYRTEPGSLSLENAGSADAWDILVPLEADPFAYGPRQTISTVQIVQAPADLAGPTRYAMRYVLPAIKGDAPAPLRVQITPAGGTSLDFAAKWLLVSSAGDSAMAHAIADIGTGDGFTAGTGTAAAAAGAAYFGGSYRAVSIAAATPNLLNRLSGNLPVVPLGRYKILLRCNLPSSVLGKTLLAQLRLTSAAGATAYGQTTRFVLDGAAATVREFWLDLGDFSIPFGIAPSTDAGPAAGAVGFQVFMGTVEGTSVTINIDSIKLIPVDGPHVSQARTLTSTGPDTVPLTNGVAGVFDGDTESYWSYNTGSNTFYVGAPVLQGGFLTADPAAAQNIITVMAVDGTASASATIASLGQLAALDISYFPRHLHIGDGT